MRPNYIRYLPTRLSNFNKTMGVCVEQVEELIEIIRSNRELVCGLRTKEGRDKLARLWDEAAIRLNALAKSDYDKRTPIFWRTFYNDYKSKLFRKAKKIRSGFSNKDSTYTKRKMLTPLEARLYSILWNDFESELEAAQSTEVLMTKDSQSSSDMGYITLEGNEDQSTCSSPARSVKVEIECQDNNFSCLDDNSKQNNNLLSIWEGAINKMDPKQQVYVNKAITDFLLEGNVRLMHEDNDINNESTYERPFNKIKRRCHFNADSNFSIDSNLIEDSLHTVQLQMAEDKLEQQRKLHELELKQMKNKIAFEKRKQIIEIRYLKRKYNASL